MWATRVSSGTVSMLNQKVYKHIEEGYPYVCLDGIRRHKCEGRIASGHTASVSVPVRSTRVELLVAVRKSL